MARRKTSSPNRAEQQTQSGDNGDGTDGNDGNNTATAAGTAGNAAVNLMLIDIALRAGSYLAKSYLARDQMEKKGQPAPPPAEEGEKAPEKKSKGLALTSYALSRVATRSVPGAIIVSGGILAKTLFDLSQRRRRAQQEYARPDRAQQDQEPETDQGK